MENKMTYSAVIPVYNSAPVLEELYQRLVRVMESLGEPFELIFVEDSGRDASWEVLKKISERDGRVLAIRLMRNFGQSNAVMCGLMRSRGDFIITIDDDLQNPPEEILKLVKAIKEMPDADVVMGIPKEKQHSFLRRIGSDLVGKVNSLIFKRNASLKLSSFRILKKGLVDHLKTFHLLNASIDALICAVTAHIANTEVEHRKRKCGKSGYNFLRLLQQALNNFMGFSVFPLRLMAVLGLLGIGVSLVFSAYFLWRYFIMKDIGIPGWMSLIILLNFLSGFTFFAFGLVGEYLLRILHCTSRGSSFFIKEISKNKEL